MENTQDLIFKVCYQEVNHVPKRQCWTSKLINKVKKHKVVAFSIILAILLSIIDGIFVANFVKLLERLG